MNKCKLQCLNLQLYTYKAYTHKVWSLLKLRNAPLTNLFSLGDPWIFLQKRVSLICKKPSYINSNDIIHCVVHLFFIFSITITITPQQKKSITITILIAATKKRQLQWQLQLLVVNFNYNFNYFLLTYLYLYFVLLIFAHQNTVF